MAVRVNRSIAFAFYLVIVLASIRCSDLKRNRFHPEIPESDIREGKRLASKYCQSCHQLPDPAMLDATTWENGVLPFMGPRLGIFKFNYHNYPSSINDKSLEPGHYPSTPLVSTKEWAQIVSYYISVSPDTLVDDKENQIEVSKDLPGFKTLLPVSLRDNPSATLVKVIDKQSGGGFALNQSFGEKLLRYNSSMQVIDSVITNGPIVDLEITNNRWLVCNIGVLNPNNGKFGSGGFLNISPTAKLQPDTNFLFKGLARPVQIASADLNKDGKTDYAVCEFGYLTGALSWMENVEDGRFVRHVIKPQPGAIKTYVNDYNRDGLPDLWVLFTQGKEGISLFTNKGNGNFEEKEILSFPSVYGSSYFEMVDFDNDGNMDIVYTCGDNADYSPILKPYHGVYVFINDGKYNFDQKYFFHINGCFKAIARDYDNDGDIDIATISFFADYVNRPEEGFVYLENKGNYTFTPRSFPEAKKGRWLTMDAGDINNDGKLDLILGNFSIGPLMIKPKLDWTKGPPFIVLQNASR